MVARVQCPVLEDFRGLGYLLRHGYDCRTAGQTGHESSR